MSGSAARDSGPESGTDTPESSLLPMSGSPEPTVGTGTIVAVGCLALLLIAVIVVAATRFVPYLSR